MPKPGQRKPRRAPSFAQLLDRMPRAFRPRLHPKTLHTISLFQHINLDDIATGRADIHIVWDYAANVLCWHRVAHAIGRGTFEMNDQLAVATRLVQRYKQHGRVAFDGPDLQTARAGGAIMDQLATMVDEPTAVEASAWAQLEMERMRHQAAQEAAQQAPQQAAQPAQPHPQEATA